MNGGLLNIWREVGAYLRYADAKCVFLAGVSFGLMLSFINFSSINTGLTWEAPSYLLYAEFDARSWLGVFSFLIAFIFSAAATIPALSRSSIRISLLNRMGAFFSRNDNNTLPKSVIFFKDISYRSSAGDYANSLQIAMEHDSEFSAAERELIEQIWIISKTTTAKFFAANVSIFSIIAGLLFSLILPR